MAVVQLVTGRFNDFQPLNVDGTLPAALTWKKILEKDYTRIAITIQNQHATALFYVCNRQPGRLTQAIRFTPNMALARDWATPQDEVWIATDTPAALLTIQEAFVTEAQA